MNFNDIRLYARTSKAEDAIIDNFLRDLENTLEKLPSFVMTIISYFDAKVGRIVKDAELRGIVEKHCLGEKN